MKKTKPNELCSCGSGKKYKHCCRPHASGLVAAVAGDHKAVAKAIELAMAQHKQGRLHEAKLIYESILKVQPDNAHAIHYIGMIAYQSENYAEAEKWLRKSIALDFTNPMYFCNFGMVLRHLGKYAESVAALNTALELKPDYDEAYLNLSAVHFNLHQFEKSAECARKAIAINPASVKSYDNLGTALRSLHDFSGSVESYQRAIQLDPNYVAAYSNISATYFEMRDMNAVCKYCLQAIKLDPNHANAYLYLGMALQHMGDLEGAEKIMIRAVALAPKHFLTHWNIGLLMLAMGKLKTGWEAYECRWHLETNPVAAQDYPFPWWLGEPFPDKTILVWPEQGIGDQIMFANMIEDLTGRFKRCVIVCPAKLVSLIARSFPQAQVVCQDDRPLLAELAPTIDVQSAIGSLARWLRPTTASFPKKDQYLFPAPDRVAHWKLRLAELGPELKVGICWRSGNSLGSRKHHCTEVDQWGPVFAIPGIQFVNLQYDDCASELRKIDDLFGVTVHQFPEVDLFDDLDETAALTKALDIVIGIPTASVILAAALGVPAWMMWSGFTWLRLGTKEICWYTSARLFQRRWDQEWEEIIDQIVEQLKLEVQGREQSNAA